MVAGRQEGRALSQRVQLRVSLGPKRAETHVSRHSGRGEIAGDTAGMQARCRRAAGCGCEDVLGCSTCTPSQRGHHPTRAWRNRYRGQFRTLHARAQSSNSADGTPPGQGMRVILGWPGIPQPDCITSEVQHGHLSFWYLCFRSICTCPALLEHPCLLVRSVMRTRAMCRAFSTGGLSPPTAHTRYHEARIRFLSLAFLFHKFPVCM